MEKWKKIGRFADLDLEACGDKRRLVDAKGRVVDFYVEGLESEEE